jgi:hypothetical protein
MAGCPKCITIGFETTECLTEPPRQVYSLRFGHTTTPRRTLLGNTGSLIGRRWDRTHVYHFAGKTDPLDRCISGSKCGSRIDFCMRKMCQKSLGVARSLDVKRSLRNMWDTG